MIAERLGALVQSKQIAFRCSDSAGPPRCTLGDLDAVIVPSDPLLTGDTAIVHVSVTWRVNPPTRLAFATKDMILTLTRSGSGWRVTDERLTRIT